MCYIQGFFGKGNAMRKILPALVFASAATLGNSGIAGEVSRAIFTIGVDNREPVIAVDSIDNASYTSISFFTELTDLAGRRVTHQWTYGDKVMFEKTFEVRGPRWRVWTSKTLIPDWTGTWTVNVLDEDGSLLASESFEYR